MTLPTNVNNFVHEFEDGQRVFLLLAVVDAKRQTDFSIQ